MTDLLSGAQIAALEPLMNTLLDAADAYDMGSLAFDPRCGIHGARPQSNVECCCSGTRYSAVEFVHALQADVKAAQIRTAPSGRPNARRDGHLRLASAG